MKQLFLDTSNQYLYLAVIENGSILFEHKQIGNNNHSETLISVIETCFSENKITVDEIDEIYVGRGIKDLILSAHSITLTPPR